MKMNKRIISLALTSTMVLGSFSMAFADTAATNKDTVEIVESVDTLDTSLTTQQKIDYLVERGFVQGNDAGDLLLDQEIDRASVAKIMSIAVLNTRDNTMEDIENQIASKNYEGIYKDVSKDSWYNANVNVVTEKAITNGTGQDMFSPNKNTTYVEIMTMLNRVLGLELNENPDWKEENINIAKENGILDGVSVDGTFSDDALRAQVFEMLYNVVAVQETPADLTVESVSAIDANTIEVKFEGVEEPVEITLEEALNHGDNYVEFSHNGQDFDAIVNYVDEDVVEIEEAVTAAEDAIAALPENVIPETLEEVKAQVANAKELVRIAQELDENVVFDTYPIEQLEMKIDVLEEQMSIDETVDAANQAIADLPENVTAETYDETRVKLAKAIYLVDLAEKADSNVVFDKYPIEQLEEKMDAFRADMEIAESAEEVKELIQALPVAIADVTLADKADAEAARKAYDALSDEAKELVSGDEFIGHLERVEAKIAELEEEAEAIENVKELIQVFPSSIKAITLDNEEDIEAARAAYDALSDEAKEVVRNTSDDYTSDYVGHLERAEAKIVELKTPTDEELEDQEKIDAAVKLAQDAVNKLDGVEITADNVEEIKAQIANAKDLVAKAEEMDENVVFDVYPLEQAEEAVAEYEEIEKPTDEELEEQQKIDAAVKLAQDSVNALDGVEITADNVEEVKLQIANAKDLVAKAEEMDENVVFDMYPLEQAEEAVTDFVTPSEEEIENQEKIDAAVKAAQDAVNSLDGVEITADNVEQVKLDIAEARALLATAKEMDDNVVFDEYPLEQAEEAVSDFVEVPEEEIEEQEKIDAAVKLAQDAVNALDDVEEVTSENVEEVKDQIADAKDLVAAAEELDENVVFDMYPLDQAEEKVADFEESSEIVDSAKEEQIAEKLEDFADKSLEEQKVILDDVAVIVEGMNRAPKEDVQNKIDAATESYEEAVAEEADKAAAEEVVEMIKDLPLASNITLESKADVEAARKAFNDLSDEAKALVGNLKGLENREDAIDALEAEVDQVTATISQHGEVLLGIRSYAIEITGADIETDLSNVKVSANGMDKSIELIDGFVRFNDGQKTLENVVLTVNDVVVNVVEK